MSDVFFCWIEEQTVRRAQCVVFTTPGTTRMYAERYPHLPASRWHTIANGYDEENFEAAHVAMTPRETSGQRITLVHSSLLYPSERDPSAFFDALATMKGEVEITSEQLRVVLRATGHDDYYRHMLAAREIQDIVSLEPAIPYEQALAEMLSADGLLVFQASNCNHQIPAKVYEYLRTRRPILALTDPRGDTAELLGTCGIDTQAPLTEASKIRAGLLGFLHLIRTRQAPLPRENIVANYSRRAQTAELARMLDSVCVCAKGLEGNRSTEYPRNAR